MAVAISGMPAGSAGWPGAASWQISTANTYNTQAPVLEYKIPMLSVLLLFVINAEAARSRRFEESEPG
jgi:hypothetical protein